MNNVPLSGFTLLKVERNNEVGLLLQLQNRAVSGARDSFICRIVFRALSSQAYRFFASSKFIKKHSGCGLAQASLCMFSWLIFLRLHKYLSIHAKGINECVETRQNATLCPSASLTHGDMEERERNK